MKYMAYDTTNIFGRQNEYRDKEFAQRIAEETNGEFIDTEYKDAQGAYWIVIWR
jgi:hypothetical protein